MLKVIKKGTDNGFLNPVDSGIRFGFIDKPLVFEFEYPEDDKPTKFTFYVKIDPEKERWDVKIDSSNIEDVKLIFSNPTIDGSSGLSAPVGLVAKHGYIIGFMFWLEMLGKNSAYKLSYEVYGDRLPEGEVENEGL